MESYRKRSISSSSNEGLQTLLERKTKEDDLFSCQVITCEFCDEAFLNRYNYLVHNANHIIIPLLRQTYFRCHECHRQCRTDRKLQKHMKKRHSHLKTHRNKKHSTDSDDSKESQINTNVNSDKYDEYIIPDLEIRIEERTKDMEVPTGNILTECVLTKEDTNMDVEIIEIESDDDIIEIKDISNHNIEKEKMRNRLVFEDEEEDIIKPNGLINDLMSDIKVSVNLEPWMSSITSNDDKAAPDWEKLSEEWRSKTVSYQDLMKTQDVACRYCNQTFPDRLSLIIHESTHITNKRLLRRPFLCQFCDWYVSSDPQGLRKHHKIMHPGQEVKPMQTINRKTCILCKLKYISIGKHMRNYHHIEYKETDQKDKDKDTETTREDIFLHNERLFQKRVIKVCDLCASFFKNVTNLLYYRSIGEKSVYGERQTCDRCLKQFFSINLVEMSSRLSQVKEKRKEKPLSNLDRLKNIQNRLKMINKIRKYYLCFITLEC